MVASGNGFSEANHVGFLDYLIGSQKKSADVAVERLQIILAHERSGRGDAPDYLPALRQEILRAVAKYIEIDVSQIKVSLDRHGDYEVLELNIPLPEHKKK